MHSKPIEDVKKQVRSAAEQLQVEIKKAVEDFEYTLGSPLSGDIRIYERWVIDNVIKTLENAHTLSTMESARFGGMPGWFDFYATPGVKPTPEQREAAKVLFGEKGDLTEFIRANTQIWRDSWITKPLAHAIEVLKTAQGKY